MAGWLAGWSGRAWAQPPTRDGLQRRRRRGQGSSTLHGHGCPLLAPRVAPGLRWPLAHLPFAIRSPGELALISSRVSPQLASEVHGLLSIAACAGVGCCNHGHTSAAVAVSTSGLMLLYLSIQDGDLLVGGLPVLDCNYPSLCPSTRVSTVAPACLLSADARLCRLKAHAASTDPVIQYADSPLAVKIDWGRTAGIVEGLVRHGVQGLRVPDRGEE